ncbi:hypothetical protein [Streptomyces sp. Caat 7-52]|uniref:hypothetical protein n=1 Tax=Streptomyces sp. Caat 7-52 TaxID=2949637 RepID=UPI0020362D66|nr:hypothetical protein [Streptomyces sp. Caat 7-52]
MLVRITDIQRCEVRPGRLVEWTLSPATVAAAAALPDDSRRPAYIQESHIRTAGYVREDGLFVPTWLGTAFDLPGPVGLDALERALRTWTVRHEPLRSGFRWAGDELRRFTLDASDVSLCRKDAGDFPDADGLVRYLQDRFDTAADALRWPNLLYTAVVRDDGASVYLAFDHSNVDAYSVQRIPAEIRELYTAGPAGAGTEAHPPAASYVDFCEIERAQADGIDGRHAIVDRWREFIRRCGGTLPGSFPEALRAVRAELQANRSLARMPLPRVLDLLGADFRPTSPDLYSIVSYVDTRATAGAERWAELKAYGLLRVSYGDQVCVWVNRLPEGLWLASRHPDTDVAAKNMRLYVERLRDRIASVAHGSLSAVS